MVSRIRRILKAVHPEGIPWPNSLLYNAASKTRIFQEGYELIASDILAHCPAGRILDIGTGPAHLLLNLARRSPGVSLTGLDISSGMISAARRNVRGAGVPAKIDIEKGSASDLPFPEDSFDAVVSTGSLHQWKNALDAINEIHRVLVPGGYALLYDMVSDTPEQAIEELNRGFGRLRSLLMRFHTFTEPFYSSGDLEMLARSSFFGEGQTRFVGVVCCLTLKKMEDAA